MVEEKKYVDAKGVEWIRIFTVPQAATDTNINPLDAKDFAEKTGKKKGTYGDLLDQSKEASEKRKQKIGIDPIKKEYWDNYAKIRNGKRHPKSYED